MNKLKITSSRWFMSLLWIVIEVGNGSTMTRLKSVKKAKFSLELVGSLRSEFSVQAVGRLSTIVVGM